MARITSKYNTGGYIFGQGVTGTVATGGTDSNAQTSPLTPITISQLVANVESSSPDTVGLYTLTVNDVDLALNLASGSTAGDTGCGSIVFCDSVTSPVFNIYVSQQDVVTTTWLNNDGSHTAVVSADWSGAYTSPGSGIETATAASANQFGTGRILNMGMGTGTSGTYSGQPNTHSALALDFLVVQAETTAATITGFAINDEDMITIGSSGSVSSQTYRRDCPNHPLFGLEVDRRDTISISFGANSGGTMISMSYAARLAGE